MKKGGEGRVGKERDGKGQGREDTGEGLNGREEAR